MQSILVALQNHNTSIGSNTLATTTEFTLPVPKAYGEADEARLKRDLELVGDALKKNPGKFCSLVNAALQSDTNKAKTLLTEMNLTEEQVEAEGGGWIGLIIAAGILLYSQQAH